MMGHTLPPRRCLGQLAWLVMIATLPLSGCRNETERAAMARAPGPEARALTPVAHTGAGANTSAPRLRRLWGGSDFNFFASSPSPDGRYVTEIDWSTGDLAVRDLLTGRLHRLTDKGSWEASADYAEVARFSPDGRRIVFGWYRGVTDAYEVRVLDFSVDESGTPRATDPRVVHPGGAQYVFWLYGWTEDDEILVGLYRPDNSTALGFLSLTTGSIRVLKSFDWADAHAALSPDGHLIAYDHPPGDDRRERDVYLMTADGTDHTRLIAGPGSDVVLGWVPSDGSLLYYSEGPGSPSILRLPMTGARPSGPPELVYEGVRDLEPLGFAGRDFYFGREVDAPRVRSATIDLTSRRLTDQRRLLEADTGPNTIRASAWAPDGEYLMHYIPEGPARSRFALSSADGSPVKEWSAPLRLKSWMIRWMPDGEALVLSGQDDRGRAGFFRMDLATGNLELIRRFDRALGARSFSLSPDGMTLYFTRVSEDGHEPEAGFVEIVARDLVTGAERSVHQVANQRANLGTSHSSPLAIHPDGSELVYPEMAADREATLWLLPLNGGAPRALLQVTDPGLDEIVGWDPEGDHLYFLTRRSGSPESPSDGEPQPEEQNWSTADVELWRVSRQSGDAGRLGVIRDYVGGASLHPDGRSLLYRSGRPRGEIWALEVGGERGAVDEGASR